MRCVVLRRLVLVGLSASIATSCADGSVGDDEPTTTTTSDDGPGSTGETEAGPMLDEPYGACVGEQVSTECIDAGPDAAQCLERNDSGGLPYSSCAITCFDDGDCPAAGAGNVSPHCWGADDATPGHCLLDCYLEANTCASGTICVDGDPPICMWPGGVPGHPDAQSFCDTACGSCGATLLLPWPSDCVAECLGDLADCSEPQLQQVFSCTGGEACPVGGLAVADCLASIACVMGSG